MDCHWGAQAGHDPVETLRRYGNRIQSRHGKDCKASVAPSLDLGPEAAHFTEAGTRRLDWKWILRLAENNHVPYSFAEQDRTERPRLESLQISYDNLVKLVGRG